MLPIAITAWSAKVCSSSICFSLNGRTSIRRSAITPMHAPSRSRGTASTVRAPSRRASSRPSGNSSPSDDRSRPVLHLEYKLIAIPQDDVGLFRLANYAGALYDRRQNRSDIGRRRGDHLEDIGAAGLVGEGLSQIARLGLH